MYIREKGWTALPAAVQKIRPDIKDRKICIVTDRNVATLYADAVSSVLGDVCAAVHIAVLPAGEEYKNTDSVGQILETMVEAGYDRQDLIAALGGGVIGDMAGLAAALYMRGIDYIQLPTTLLAMADASIGGKTGVDYGIYKNLIGAFHQPVLTYANQDVLRTLPKSVLRAGMAEVIKAAILDSEESVRMLESFQGCPDGNGTRTGELPDDEMTGRMIDMAVRVKTGIVDADPFEQGCRKYLNLGHTFAHALESESRFTIMHGYCVAAGTAAAARTSAALGLLSDEDVYRIESLFTAFGLPVRYPGYDPEALLEHMFHDKKNDSGKLGLVLLSGIGKPVFGCDAGCELLLRVLGDLSKE